MLYCYFGENALCTFFVRENAPSNTCVIATFILITHIRLSISADRLGFGVRVLTEDKIMGYGIIDE